MRHVLLCHCVQDCRITIGSEQYQVLTVVANRNLDFAVGLLQGSSLHEGAELPSTKCICDADDLATKLCSTF